MLKSLGTFGPFAWGRRKKGEIGKCFLKNEVIIFCEQFSKDKEEHTSSSGETGVPGREGVGEG